MGVAAVFLREAIVDDGPNPYAPPLTDPRERLDAMSDEVLTARFEMTPAWRKSTAHALIMPGAGWLFAAMIVLLAGMGLTFAVVANRPQLMPHQALLLSLIVGGIAAILYHIGIHEYLTRRIVRRMRDVPVLAADGEWNVSISPTELTLRTSGGERTWALAELWWHPVREPLVLLQLPRDLPLGIPPQAECGVEFRLFAQAVRKRVRPPGLTYFLRD